MKDHKWLKYCPEHYKEIENYDLALADDFKGWICHHRNGLEFSREWLIKNNMYFNRKDPHEFKFMKHDEHARLHCKLNFCRKLNFSRKGWHLSNETKLKLSTILTGRKRTEETKMKMSNSHKGKKRKPFSDETRKRMSISQSKRRVYERIS